ncbi:hypothetical protein MNEG_11874 [Monoraphidium neglectum]|uniref:Uncharacterized protein n=1 Tax=Monoraphidium neglectum TaxID=145388 RepID=A0A0D2KJR8_9CHLO|nr:hypothetical protein MNEG_11874 [Monoraphidium neglectum]KIY96088.1 hypothetical protein MNEG_11874 [Monoraphidium neglectum]|eukprot:XP_013895108.1 hypothetical protein MNEG_11874 [Monoraphidium neglectum]
MCAYTVAKACPETCVARNARGQRPLDVAAACGRGEVLNAMLLACAGDAGGAAVDAMLELLTAGAVPDTWAPSGSSALMLAACADGVGALRVLLEGGASVELQDALGRSALMFAAGSSATGAIAALLDAGAAIGARDRRGRTALEYAPKGSAAEKLLRERLAALEVVAAARQAELLELLSDGRGGAASGGCSGGGSGGGGGACAEAGEAGAAGRKKKKRGKKAGEAAAPAVVAVQEAAPAAEGERHLQQKEQQEQQQQQQEEDEQQEKEFSAVAEPVAAVTSAGLHVKATPSPRPARSHGKPPGPDSAAAADEAAAPRTPPPTAPQAAPPASAGGAAAAPTGALPTWQPPAAPAAASELEVLRAENAALRQQLSRLGSSHQRELASVLSDAAAHEAGAVHDAAAAAAAAAVAAERGRWLVRLQALGAPAAALLQLAVGDTCGSSGGSGGDRSLWEQLVRAAASAATSSVLPSGFDVPPLPRRTSSSDVLGSSWPPCSLPLLPQHYLSSRLPATPGTATPSGTAGTPTAAALSEGASVLQHLRDEYQNGGSCFVAAARHSLLAGDDGTPGAAVGGAGPAAGRAAAARPGSVGGSSDGFDGGGAAASALTAWGLDPIVCPAPGAALHLPAIGSGGGGNSGAAARQLLCGAAGGALEGGGRCTRSLSSFLPDDLLA